jgi:hypothetical protein
MLWHFCISPTISLAKSSLSTTSPRNSRMKLRSLVDTPLVLAAHVGVDRGATVGHDRASAGTPSRCQMARTSNQTNQSRI